ncbi:DUF6804 family protein [Planctomonas deserti]|uniref:DUF6804 family protein n=1 Tax=Planctomonas deserti TaxID=2144185 RepID=UPI000D398D0B|nr:DUF6804 family protein [Planctomonas deserti]
MPNRPAPASAADFLRPALAPGLLGAIVLVAGLALIDTSWFVPVRFIVAILALIMCVFAVRGRAWWALPFLAAIAVLWNPVVVIPVDDQPWQALQFAAALVMVVAGILIRVPAEDARASAGPRRGSR